LNQSGSFEKDRGTAVEKWAWQSAGPQQLTVGIRILVQPVLTILVLRVSFPIMNTQLLSERIAKAAAPGDFVSVQKLGAIAQNLDEIREKVRGLAQEKAALQEELHSSQRSTPSPHHAFPFEVRNRNGSREAYSRGNLTVEITLPKVGAIRIAERTAAERMFVLMQHLLTSLGLGALDRLQQFRT